MKLCEKLKGMYKADKKTYREIEAGIGFSRMTIRHWMNGSSIPSLCTVKCIADYYGMTMSELLEGVDEV